MSKVEEHIRCLAETDVIAQHFLERYDKGEISWEWCLCHLVLIYASLSEALADKFKYNLQAHSEKVVHTLKEE